jgi:hypothetical protein
MSDTQPLSISLNLSDISTTVPLIADGTMAKVRLKNISQTERDGNPVIKWEFTLAEPALTTEGDQVRAGFPLFTTFDTSHEFLMQKMARFVDGFLGTGDANNKKGKARRPTFNAEVVSQMIGSEAMAKITVMKSKKSDYVGNDIATLTYLGDLEPAEA